MSTTRKNQINLQLFRTLQFLNEADMPGTAAPAQQQTPQAVANSNPMQALPGQTQQAQQQVVGSSGGEPMTETGEPLSVDTIIDRLNIIRGGKSFSEPEVYGQLTTLYKGMGDQDKVSVEKTLTEIGKIVAQQQTPQVAPAGQMRGTTPAQPPPGGAQGRPGGAGSAGASAAPAGTGGGAGPTA